VGFASKQFSIAPEFLVLAFESVSTSAMGVAAPRKPGPGNRRVTRRTRRSALVRPAPPPRQTRRLPHTSRKSKAKEARSRAGDGLADGFYGSAEEKGAE